MAGIVMNMAQPRPNMGDIWDPITVTRINTLHPAIRDDTAGFILDLQSQGKYVRVTQAFRTFEEQQAIFNSDVQAALPGHSWHNFGLAFDVVEVRDGNPTEENMLWSNPNWDIITELGRSMGFATSADFQRSPYYGHFEMSFGFTTAELRERVREGRVLDGFVILH